MIIRFIRIIVSNIRQILSNVEYAGVNTQEDKMDIACRTLVLLLLREHNRVRIFRFIDGYRCTVRLRGK